MQNFCHVFIHHKYVGITRLNLTGGLSYKQWLPSRKPFGTHWSSPKLQSTNAECTMLTTDECHFFKIRLNENQIWCDAKLCLRDIHMAKHLTVPTAQYREFMIVNELWKKGSAPMCLI